MELNSAKFRQVVNRISPTWGGGGGSDIRIEVLLIYSTKLRRESRGVYSAGLLRSQSADLVRAIRAIRAMRAMRTRHSGLTRQMYLTIMVFRLEGIVGIVGQVGIVALESPDRVVPER